MNKGPHPPPPLITYKTRGVQKPQGLLRGLETPDPPPQIYFITASLDSFPRSPPGTKKQPLLSPRWFNEAPNAFTRDSGGD